jgi:peptidoglycan-associated lipoprotein
VRQRGPIEAADPAEAGACRLQLGVGVRGSIPFVCAVALMSACQKNAPPPVAPTQPTTSTGSGDKRDLDIPVVMDTVSKETPPAPVRSKFGPIYFPFDSADLDEKARGELSALGDFLSSHGTSKVEISGHTDERGTTEYNLALGERRATSAKEYLTRLGVAAERINTISYGEERPAAEGSGEQSWSLNRRCELQLADR